MRRFLPALFFLLLLKTLSAQLPAGFSDETISGGWTLPAGITFDENGQGYVWGSYGLVFVLDTTGFVHPEPLLDLREEVGRWLDHGMLGFTLDPNFLENGRFYVLYTVDRHHLLHFGSPDYDPGLTVTHEATIARITRYSADPALGFRSILPGSREVLAGKTAADGFPILFDAHGVGALAFGADGSLLASCGESASSVSIDNGHNDQTDYAQALADGILKPEENVGAFRSQLIDNLNGKIIRIDPATGDGLPGNPFYDPAAPRSARSRVYALGLRNPFRFTRIPGTGSHLPADGQPGTLIVSDVGDQSWEELNFVTAPGQNFGWPLYEGFEAHPIYQHLLTYNATAPRDPDGGDCPGGYFRFQELLLGANDSLEAHPCGPDLLSPVFRHRPPALAYQNQSENSVPFTWVQSSGADGTVQAISMEADGSPLAGQPFQGDAGTAGVFYEGDHFPERYRGRFFLADFRDWIRTFELDDQHRLVAVEDFHTDAREVVSLAVNPRDGCLYYTSMKDKRLHRICYGGHIPPVARAEADRHFGPAPLTVQLSAAASSSPDSPLSYEWDFGDGQTGAGVSTAHTFNAAGPASFTVTLTVRDTFNNERQAALTISVNNTPPVVNISSPADNSRYPLDVTSLLRLAAEVSDAESPPTELSYDWQVNLHHNTHFHPAGAAATPLAYTLLSPLGCGSETYWYRIALTVTDPHGLSATSERRVFPDCERAWTMGELTVRASEAVVRLTWEDPGTPGLTEFEVQRSEDFYHFEKLSAIAAGAAEGGYQFTDPAPRRGINIYRIEGRAADGGIRHSNLVPVAFPAPAAMRIFPNPARESFTVKVREVWSGEIRFALFSSDGRQVRAYRWPATPEEELAREVDTRLLSEGLYFYLLSDGDRQKAGRVAIQH